MTRQLSVSALKGTNTANNYGSRPKPGTLLGNMYDAFRRGEHVHVPRGSARRRLYILQDDYGMEFVSKRGPGGYIKLKGEWEGLTFVPLERILQEEPNEQE